MKTQKEQSLKRLKSFFWICVGGFLLSTANAGCFHSALMERPIISGFFGALLGIFASGIIASGFFIIYSNKKKEV